MPSFPRNCLGDPYKPPSSIRFLWQHQQRRTLGDNHTPCTQRTQLMWSSCNLTLPAKLRCTETVRYRCEPYIRKCSNKPLRRIMAQFRTGSHWLNVETGMHRGIARENRTCHVCSHDVVNPGLRDAHFDGFDSDEGTPDPFQDEQHVIFACSG